jgi:hypothetical protein
VTETPEDAPVEPTEFVETEPGAECVVEQEENQGKQLSMIPWDIYAYIKRRSYFHAMPSLDLFIHALGTRSHLQLI